MSASGQQVVHAIPEPTLVRMALEMERIAAQRTIETGQERYADNFDGYRAMCEVIGRIPRSGAYFEGRQMFELGYEEDEVVGFDTVIAGTDALAGYRARRMEYENLFIAEVSPPALRNEWLDAEGGYSVPAHPAASVAGLQRLAEQETSPGLGL